MKIDLFNKVLAAAVVTILVAQVLLFLVSWLVTAASPDTEMRSLLSNEGIRWFFGSFTHNVANPPLAWIVLMAMAWGTMKDSKIIDVLRNRKQKPTYRQTFALRMVAFMILAFMVIVFLVAFIPHAPLLSATGRLFPSPFSVSLIPMIAAECTICAATYGVMVGVLRNAADVVMAMANGIAKAAPIIVVYIMAAELIASFDYVFRIYW